MLRQTDRTSHKSQLSAFGALISHPAVAFLLLTLFHGGHSQVIGQPQQIVAMVGDDITLPCHVKPASDVFDEMLEWSRPDLSLKFVHVRRSGEDLLDQNPSYRGRTSVSINSLKQGDVSLKLSKVKFSDEGTYTCLMPRLKKQSSVQLVVGPVINITKVDRGVLQCESTGWYPEREVFWLDGEGNLLSAGPTETVRGPDGLYTVSSRVTVEKRHNNNFTCRVQQKNIKQTRETYIIVPDDFFTESSRSSASTVIGVIVGIIFILAVVFLLWKWRQNKLKTKKCHGDKDKWKTRDKKSNSTSNGPEQESLIKEDETQSTNNKTAGQGPTGGERQQEDQQAGGEAKDNLDQTGNEEKKDSCPAKKEAQQDKNKDGRDGEENLREPIKDNTNHQSPADGQTDQHPAPDNSTAVQGPIPGGTQQDETRAEQQPSTEETEKQSDVDKRQGDKNKTEQLTVEQPEKSPESTDGEENITPEKDDTISQPPVSGQTNQPQAGKTELDEKDAEEEPKPKDNKTTDQVPTEVKTEQSTQQEGRETNNNLEQTGNEEKKASCPAKKEGQQDKNKDGRDGEENLREPLKDNTKPQSPADGQTDQHPAPDNSTAVQGPIPGGTRQDETRAEQQPSTEKTEKQSDVDKRQGDNESTSVTHVKTEQPTEGQPESSPESTDGEENTTSNDTNVQSPTGDRQTELLPAGDVKREVENKGDKMDEKGHSDQKQGETHGGQQENNLKDGQEKTSTSANKTEPPTAVNNNRAKNTESDEEMKEGAIEEDGKGQTGGEMTDPDKENKIKGEIDPKGDETAV